MAGTLETSTEQSLHHYSERCALYRTTEVFPLLFLKLSTWFFLEFLCHRNRYEEPQRCGRVPQAEPRSEDLGKNAFRSRKWEERRPENDDFSEKMWGSGDERRPVREPRKDVKLRETSGFGEGRSSLKSRRCEIWGE